eukprot:gene4028-4665_t
MSTINLLSTSRCYQGEVRRYSHTSACLDSTMNFTVFVPDSITQHAVPALWFLSGLTCTDENFITKAGAIQTASREKIMLVCPDTSPRGTSIEGERDSWEFGQSAGYYLDATVDKYSKNYNMYTYITKELFSIISSSFNVTKHSIFGHSMGGHGAIMITLRNPGQYQSVSAFAPIANPLECGIGQRAFLGFLGEDKTTWSQYDSTALAKAYTGRSLDILIDQGSKDDFLPNLLPQNFVDACKSNESHLSVNYRFHEGYNHGYYFIQTFIEDHIKYHSKYLN